MHMCISPVEPGAVGSCGPGFQTPLRRHLLDVDKELGPGLGASSRPNGRDGHLVAMAAQEAETPPDLM